MANAKGQEIDKTHLSIDIAEERGIVHRDYLAHCLRWSHVVKHLYKSRAYSSAVILDVGCGKELPMAKLLYSNRLIPERYIGVDVNKLDIESFNFGKMKEVMTLFGKCDFSKNVSVVGDDQIFIGTHVDAQLYDGALERVRGYTFKRPNIITCFEVLEHVEPAHAREILLKIHDVMHYDGVAFISTPNWNGKDTASNHVNEMRFEALGKLIMDCGFGIQDVYGTFASQRELEPALHLQHPTITEVYDQLKQYYDSNVLSVIFAPLFPEDSRNCLWKLTKKPDLDAESFSQPYSIAFNRMHWAEIQQPWTSSERWKELMSL